MTVDLAELLAQVEDRLIQDWASDLHRRFGPVPHGSPDFSSLGRLVISDLIHYLRRGDPGALRAVAAGEGILRLRRALGLAEVIQGFLALRDLAVRTLEGQMHAPSALYGASRRLSAAMDLVLVEVARQSERPLGRLDLAPSKAEEVNQHLDREIRRALRFQRPLSLLLVEVDRYDEYMRLYGAALAELAASAVTGAMGRVTRGVDIKCPVEDGVFAVILPESTLEAARVVAERIRTAVEASEVHREQTLVVSGVTVSIGVVSFPVHGEHPAALLEAARHTLTQARRLGPNTVMVSEWQRSSEHVQ